MRKYNKFLNHHFATPSEIFDSAKHHQWVKQIRGEYFKRRGKQIKPMEQNHNNYLIYIMDVCGLLFSAFCMCLKNFIKSLKRMVYPN